ncbi:MAG TPA: choice-of-anchor J domain-containing protein [Thermoanaerobaculia bacterium]|jgi:hypothetical protein|nr:choice-of-anchor J domain-containing protein [Thermoanaerobaculia bacterium]
MNRKIRLASIVLLSAVASLGVAAAQQMNEGFEGAFPPTGWLVRNQSQSIGTNTTCWNLFTATPWAPHGGVNHTGANFNCTANADTISGWLITKQLTALQNGNQISFWTRTANAPTQFPDRLEVRQCIDTTPDSCGAAGSSGATSADVGSFTTLLTTVNPSLVTSGAGAYPTVFTQFSVTLSGLPAGPNAGRFAFRYFVNDAGPLGNNSNIISIDDVVVTDTTPVELMSFEVN